MNQSAEAQHPANWSLDLVLMQLDLQNGIVTARFAECSSRTDQLVGQQTSQMIRVMPASAD
jgi:hypothetical protein